MNRPVVVYDMGGWCLVLESTGEIVAGPCDTMEELKQDYERRLYRLSQGWAP